MDAVALNVQEILQKQDQMQVMRFYDQLNDQEKENLSAQVAAVDFDMIASAMKSSGKEKKDVIESVETMTVPKIASRKEEYKAAGEKALKEGKLAAVILAGGQGSRLGHDGPKGTLNVGLTKEKYIFECLLENVKRNMDPVGQTMHVYIMTSDVNHEATVDFFEEKGYFGYPRSYVHFFKQDMAPALDKNGKLLLETKSSLSLAPNGNGGWFRTLQRAGLVEEMKQNGVEWLNVVSVDNILQDIGDPIYLGACILNNHYAGGKVISKVSPDEKVGACCLRNGRPSVVEYTELTEEMRQAKGEDGLYLYQFGVTLNYLFHIETTEEKAGGNLPVHQAIKKITCLDEEGNTIVPADPNAIKLEYFIFDILEFFDSCLFFECIREDEFAPIKNRTGVDSLDSARELYTAKYGNIL